MSADGLTREQRAAVDCDAHALEIRAGAGTGKTHTLAHRVARFALADPRAQHRLLVVTFTREATATLQRRLSLLLGRDHRVQVGSFHSWAARETPREGRQFMPEAEARRIVSDVLRKARAGPGFSRALGVSPDAGDDLPTRVLGILSHAKNAEQAVETTLAARHPSALPWERLVLEARDAYESKKGDRLDFDDLIVSFRDRLRTPAFRAQARSRWAHVFVDEYQDVNAIQAETVRLVTTGRDAPQVTVVGDARQAIYGFRGGTPAHLDAFLEPYGRKGKRVALTVNFRAERALVSAANRVVADPHPMRPRPRAPTGEAPEIVACDDEVAEAALVADRIERLLAQGEDPAEIVVLARARHHLRALQDEIAARLADERRVAGPALARAVDAFLAFAQAARAPALATLPLRPGAPDWRASVRRARADPRRLLDVFAELPWADADVQRGAAVLARRARVAPPDAALDTAAGLLALPEPEGLARVVQSTIHAAKGLEWDHVVLVGAREGGLPIEHALQAPPQHQAALLEEERRLLYVAATRARRRLLVTWPRRAGRREAEASRFLANLSPPSPEPEPAPAAPALA